MQGTLPGTEVILRDQYNSGQTEGGLGTGIRCEDQAWGSVGHVTSDGRCDIEGSARLEAGDDAGGWPSTHMHQDRRR